MTATVTPDRSLAQRLEALELANEVRSRRAQLKRDLKAGFVWPGVLIVWPPDYAATMKIVDLLLATPKVGRVKANRFLKLAGVSPSKTLAGLTVRQRLELAALVGGRR